MAKLVRLLTVGQQMLPLKMMETNSSSSSTR